MQYTVSHHGDEPRDMVTATLDRFDELPDWDELTDDEQDRILEQCICDDYLCKLIVIGETLYELSDAVDEDLDGDHVVDSELFRAAEWVRSAIAVYVAGRVSEMVHVSGYEPEDVMQEVEQR